MIRWQSVIVNGRWLTLAKARALAEKEATDGNLQGAIDILGLIIAKTPKDSLIYYHRAILHYRMNQYGVALEDIERAIILKPDFRQAYVYRGILFQLTRRYEEAVASYDQAIQLNATDAEAYNNRGIALEALRRSEEALESYDKAIELKSDYAEAYNNRGASLQELKRFGPASESYAQAIALKPKYFDAYFNRGKVLVTSGDMPEAEKMFLQARLLRPDSSGPLVRLAKIRQYQDVDHPDIDAALKLSNKPGLSLLEKSELYFTLGKIYDDCRQYDRAFENYQRANEIQKSVVSYQADEMRRKTQETINVFTKEFLAASFSFASNSKTPLFVLGMPRSGTTLMASILSNHGLIGTAGELATIHESVVGLTEHGIAYPEALHNLSPLVGERLIREYLGRLKRDAPAELARIIDKQPLNFQYIGYIAKLFPAAKIIHCTRHPLDLGLSNYFARFAAPLAYSFDLRDVGHFYGEYRRLMAHWNEVLPATTMLEVSYEDMVLNTEKVTRKALEFLGLEWDERCLSPHTNPCAVETASYWQVRQPIHPQSVGKWKHYQTHLHPLEEALGPAGETDPR